MTVEFEQHVYILGFRIPLLIICDSLTYSICFVRGNNRLPPNVVRNVGNEDGKEGRLFLEQKKHINSLQKLKFQKLKKC